MNGTNETRRLLEMRLAELQSRSARIVGDLVEPLSADFEDQAVEQEDDEGLAQEYDLVGKEIAAVRAAIARLDAGDYGICTRCGAEIDPRRLEALPEAAFCVSCAKAAQAGGTPGGSARMARGHQVGASVTAS